MWKFFYKEYDDQNTIKSLICSLCKTRYKASNSPGTLATHLRTKHKEKAELVQATLDKFAPKPYSKQDQRYKELTDSIVDFIICCQLPFAIVDNLYFIKMLNLFDKKYQVPCRQTIKNEIMKRHKSMEEKIKEELATIQKVSITCDIWSSITMQSYLGVTVHYVDKEWKL